MVDRIPELYGQGQFALEQGDTDEAHRIADQLAARRNTGAYEIGARAYWQAGDHEEAVRLIRVGVDRFPQVTILWSYLGEFLSDLAQYDEALEAFERSAEGLGGSRGLADLNIALVHWRTQKYARALESLDGIQSGPRKYKVQELRATVLVDMGRFDEASEVLEDLAVSRPNVLSAQDFALMLGLMAEAELGLGNKERALDLAAQCLEVEGGHVRGLRVLRRLKSANGPDSAIGA